MDSKSKIFIRIFPDKGRGVFATEDINSGEIIEVTPVLVFSPREADFIMQTQLSDYVFMWDRNKSALALGCGSVYNHSDAPNAFYRKRSHRSDMVFTATSDIKKGEEITVSYGEHWWKKRGAKPLE